MTRSLVLVARCCSPMFASSASDCSRRSGFPDTELAQIIERARTGDLAAANSLAVHYAAAGNNEESESSARLRRQQG